MTQITLIKPIVTTISTMAGLNVATINFALLCESGDYLITEFGDYLAFE